MSKKKLILNADDFGRHELINQAVAAGVTKGYLRSATLMPGEPCFAGAVALAKAHPELGVGIHFTLVDGHPVLPAAEIPSLVTPAGKFYPHHNAFVKAYLSGKINLAEVRRELTAQLDKFLAAGLVPTHADSHQHMHILPGIFPIILDILAAKGIKRVRTPQVYGRVRDFFSGGLGDIVGRLGLWTLAAWGKWQAQRRGFATPEYFAGKVAGDAVDEAFLQELARNFPEGITEVMLHPGMENETLAQISGWQHDYVAEYQASCSPEVGELLRANDIEPANYTVIENPR